MDDMNPEPTAIPGRRTRNRQLAETTTAVAYIRVSTDEQALSGAGLDAQRAAIEAKAAQLGVTITEWFEDAGVSGTVDPDKRPGMAAALAALKRRDAGRLIAAKLDRVSRSAIDLLTLVTKRAEREGWSLVVCDMDLDTSTPQGRVMLANFAAFAQYERDLIAERTKAALAARKAAGMKLGRPTKVPDEVLRRIISETEQGRSLRTIAQGLMADGIRTGSGNATWHAVQVQRALDCDRAREIAAELYAEHTAVCPAPPPTPRGDPAMSTAHHARIATESGPITLVPEPDRVALAVNGQRIFLQTDEAHQLIDALQAAIREVQHIGQP